MVKELEWIEMAQLSILFKSLSLRLPSDRRIRHRMKGTGPAKKYNSLWLRSFRIFERDTRCLEIPDVIS